MEQAGWRGMPYFDVFWRKRHLTIRELRAIYANYYAYVFWSLVVLMLVLMDLHGFAERVSLLALLAYTTAMVAITVSFYALATAIGLKLSRRHRGFFIFYPFVGFIAITASTYLVEMGMSSTFGGGLSVQYAAEKLPSNLILGLLLETLFITFVLPVAVSDPKREPLEVEAVVQPANSRCKTLTIAGKTYLCDKLMSVSSQDHYVLIKTRDGEELLRGRLSDMIGQLDCQSGIQPHRSYWVARRAVVKMVSSASGKVLKLVDGAEIPVARGRVASVKEWLETTPTLGQPV